MNRSIAVLLIFLTIGIAVIGVLLWQKQGDLYESLSQLQEARQTATNLQSQLAQCQEDAGNLPAQLSQAQKTISALQSELAELKSPPLTPYGPVTVGGMLWGGQLSSHPFELMRLERVQGDIIVRPIGPAYGEPTPALPDKVAMQIQDPAGTVVQDFGQIRQTNFVITAQMEGNYTIVVTNPSEIYPFTYTLRWTYYRR